MSVPEALTCQKTPVLMLLATHFVMRNFYVVSHTFFRFSVCYVFACLCSVRNFVCVAISLKQLFFRKLRRFVLRTNRHMSHLEKGKRLEGLWPFGCGRRHSCCFDGSGLCPLDIKRHHSCCSDGSGLCLLSSCTDFVVHGGLV